MSAEIGAEAAQDRPAADDPLDLIAGVLGVDAAGLTDEDGRDTVPAWTSRKQIELVVALEERYGVVFGNEDVFAARTVGAVREVLRGKGVH